ncbi:MAG: protein kinase [Oscillospiraceae bacterium]|nr:protein kinase [Oscillospiraceae bacterium]
MGKKKNRAEGVIYDRIEEYEIGDFIAVGGESIVFKGVKKSVGRTYALKFRDRSRWDDFFTYELKTLSRLEKCSTSKLAGVIPAVTGTILGELYRKVPPHKQAQCSNLALTNAEYFCIVEDFIVGCDLNEYCSGDALRGITGHTPMQDAPYEQVVAFQRKLLNWTIQFCEIMAHVTEEHRFLHMDIKPENVMIANETESVTVIDFGKSMELPPRSDAVSLHEEFGEEIGVFGTDGFAAPECCDSAQMRSALGLAETGRADIRSDIFSFGAMLWDCINPEKNLRIKYSESGYFRRDLFNTPKGYIPELEALIVKCTEKDPDMRYQNYDELKKAALHAEKKLLEREKPRKTLLVFSIIAALMTVLLVFSLSVISRRESLTYEIARSNFDKMAADYTEHNLTDFKETAAALIDARPDAKQSYMDVLAVSFKDDDCVSKTELEEVLLKCLDRTNDKTIISTYVDQVMQHINYVSAKTVSESLAIRRSLDSVRSDGMEIARAIANYGSQPVESFDTLGRYRDASDYYNALLYLNKMLMNDTNLKKQIADAKGVDPDLLKSPLA